MCASTLHRSCHACGSVQLSIVGPAIMTIAGHTHPMTSLEASTQLPRLNFVATSAVCAAGVGREALAQALQASRAQLRPNTVSSRPLTTVVGEVSGLDQVQLPADLRPWDCRNHRLAHLGLRADGFEASVAKVRAAVGPHRVGVVMGTSTSSIAASEQAYRERDAQGRVPPGTHGPELHSIHALGHFVGQALALTGPSLTVSTACSSSAKALAVAQRWLALNLVDAVVVGGVDSLCDSVLFGFHALQLVSPQACRPFDARREGINLGEAAAFALVVREDDPARVPSTAAMQLLGVGESSDAHHLTAPQPEGASIEAAVRQALTRARVTADAIDYVNLHGTATPKNDAVEAAMVARVYPSTVHASSTKGCTGHTLGASGMLEVVVCELAMRDGVRWGTVGCEQPDAACGPSIRQHAQSGRVLHAVSHAFGFGGSNAVLVLGALQ